MEKQVILYNIRSAHNVGSVFRTSDGAGVNKIYLVGPTPLPTDRFGRVQPEIKKTSLGASESVAWEQVGQADDESLKETSELIVRLQAEGFVVIAIEQSEESQSFYDYSVPEKVVYIFGNEVHGVPKEILEVCDLAVEIPMKGMKESLNVSVTAGVVLFKV